MVTVSRPPAAAEPDLGSLDGPLSASSLRWWAGTFCAFLGAFMVVAPGEFVGAHYAALAPRVALWGVAFLIGGWVMLAAAATRPRQGFHAAAHVMVAAIFALLAGGFASMHAWSGTIVYSVLSLSIVVSALMPPRSARTGGRRGDLFALTMGVAQVVLGLWMVFFYTHLNPALYALSWNEMRLLGVLLVVTGLPLAAVQWWPGARRAVAWAAHLAAGVVLVATAVVAALPTRSWTGLAFYGVGGLLVALLPWLRFRLRDFDPGSLATRLALVLAAATSLPVVLTLGLLEAGHRTVVVDEHRLRAFVLLLLAVVAAVGLGIGAARALARPLRRLAEAADRLAAGEPAAPLEITGITELDRLSFNFRHMRDRLEQRSEEADDLARELRRRADALAEADRRKDEFLAMLAHELRNPLGAIGSASHLLEEIRADDRRVHRATGVIHRQMQHLTRLVDDLLDVSRITRGKVQLKKESVDLAEVVERTVEALVPRAEAAGLELTWALPDGAVPLFADATRMEQVLGNLVNNAIKYSEAGGHIRVDLELLDGEASLRVADDGMGMPPDLLPRVFDLFAQGERTLDRRGGGLGIGLTLVRQLVEMHGGRVRAHSDGVGRGSEFEVRLPLAAPAPVPPASPQPRAAS
jgi:signal transduction histidine kinase